MSVRRLLAAAASAPLVVLALAPPASAQVLVHSAAGAPALTPGRTWSLVGVVLGVAGVVAGGLALARATGGGGRRGAVLALVAGVAGAAVGGAVVAVAEGGPNTGYGIVGGVVAVVVGAVAAVLGGLALRTARRSRNAVEHPN